MTDPNNRSANDNTQAGGLSLDLGDRLSIGTSSSTIIVDDDGDNITKSLEQVDEKEQELSQLSSSSWDLLSQEELQEEHDDDRILSSTSTNTSTRRAAANDRLTSIVRTAARSTKEQFWDSNESGIVAAQTAVDLYEETYVLIRKFVVGSSRSVVGIYEASKAGARGIDRGFLIPIRDYLLLPAFGAVEHTVSGTSSFLNSPKAEVIRMITIDGSSEFVSRTVPFGLGEKIVLPVMQFSADAIRTALDVLRYPVHSPRRVRDTVDFLLNGSKKNLSFLGNEIVWYVRRADASLVRTVRRTQWSVLGSGPYETLDLMGRRDVMDHVCERYLSIGTINDNSGDDDNDNDDDDDINNNNTIDYTSMNVARYEFINNVRAFNRPLYDDLVGTGLLKKRGGNSTKNDEWLSLRPKYRRHCRNANLFLLDDNYDDDEDCEKEEQKTENNVNGGITPFALWFRLPCENGQRPKRDVPWIAFNKKDGTLLEEKYRSIIQQRLNATVVTSSTTTTSTSTTSTRGQELPQKQQQQEISSSQADEETWEAPKYATNANWYNPDKDDVLLDQKRHAVTFVHCCIKCRKLIGNDEKEDISRQVGVLCSECHSQKQQYHDVDDGCLLALPPPLVGLYRPTMWRFYGPDDIQRAVWFLDTPRNGPQPYEEDAQALLEDAYHFLKWTIREKLFQSRPNSEYNVDKPTDNDVIGKDDIAENVLLTVQVPHNGEQQLVQFSSLTMATSISKGLGGAISLFKQRVYRGAYNVPQDNDIRTSEGGNIPALVEEKRWTTTTEDALEKLKLTTTFESIVHEKSEKHNTKLDHDISLEDPGHEEEALDQSEYFFQPPPTQSKDRLQHDQPSLAFPVDPSNINFTGDDEAVDRDVAEADHLCLVVHGIGEMMQSFDLFGLKKVPTIVDCCGYLRDNHTEILDARQAINGIKENNKLERVEYLPVEWHEAFSIQSTRRSLTEAIPSPKNARSSNVTIDDISLRTIPNLRSFANDTLMDILYFMSPEHHDVITNIVVFELNFIVNRFRKLTGFEGKISIIGHSIGSIITWDILDNQKINSSVQSSPIHTEPALTKGDDSYRYPQLNFQIDSAFMLGSPIPVFLMIRNQRKPLTSTFTLSGCSKFYNIFHPYDPVSYRIEPLLHPRNAEVEPKIMTHWNGGYRFQYQTRRLWKKIVDQTRRAEENVIQGLESSIEALGLVDSTFKKNGEKSGDFNSRESSHRLMTGSLNGGRRIDYMLQEKEIDRANEYVAALAAHSCYWLEKDLSLFIANEINSNNVER